MESFDKTAEGRNKSNRRSYNNAYISLFDIAFWDPKKFTFLYNSEHLELLRLSHVLAVMEYLRIYTHISFEGRKTIYKYKTTRWYTSIKAHWMLYFLILFSVILAFYFYFIYDEDSAFQNSNFNTFHLAIYLWHCCSVVQIASQRNFVSHFCYAFLQSSFSQPYWQHSFLLLALYFPHARDNPFVFY